MAKQKTPLFHSGEKEHLSSLAEKYTRKFAKEYHHTKSHLDADSLHDLRVATRRLNALMQVFSLYGHSKEITKTRNRLKKFFKPLGKYRDLLLQLERIKSEETGSHAILRLFQAHLEQQAKVLQKEVKKSFSDFELSIVTHHWQDYLTLCRGADLDWNRYIEYKIEEIRDYEKKVFGSIEMDAIHKMRIHIKRLKYLLEILIGIIPQVKQSLIDTLDELQTVMGDIHDIDRLALEVLEFQKSLYPQETKYQDFDKYIEELRQERQEKFTEFQKIYERFKRPSH